MEALVAGGVAGLYATGVFGLHRLNVWRMRAMSGGFQSLRWLDWDSLLEGLLPPAPAAPVARPSSRVVGGGPSPELLRGPIVPGTEARRALLEALVEGVTLQEPAFAQAGFSGGEVRWLWTLALSRRDPDQALARLEQTPPTSAAEVTLREHLVLRHRVHPLNLEVAVFASKRRLGQALARFGDRAGLHFGRALASSLVGFNQPAIDSLARAVYFGRQRTFYVDAVLATPYIEAARPALFQECLRLRAHSSAA